jgi:hypothetical protein
MLWLPRQATGFPYPVARDPGATPDLVFVFGGFRGFFSGIGNFR